MSCEQCAKYQAIIKRLHIIIDNANKDHNIIIKEKDKKISELEEYKVKSNQLFKEINKLVLELKTENNDSASVGYLRKLQAENKELKEELRKTKITDKKRYSGRKIL